jgi:hypothetical protein
MGARHALFPRITDIWRSNHPSNDYWLAVPRRYAEPHERLRLHFGSVAKPNFDVTTKYCWVRLLCLVLQLSADDCSPDTDKMRLRYHIYSYGLRSAFIIKINRLP